MKKSILGGFLSVAFIFILMMGLVPISANAITLRWAHPSPKRGPEVELMKWFTSELERRTDGRVKVTVYWSGALAKIKESAEAVNNGLADIGWVSPAYHAGYGELAKIPYTTGFLSIESNPVVLTKAWIKTNEMSSGLVDELKAKNMVPFVYKWYDHYWAFTNVPIRSLKDIKGVKIRAMGELQMSAYQAVGAVPLFLPFSEVYSGLSKNIIQGVSASLDTAYRYKIQESVKYVIQLDIMGAWANWCINLKTFNKLSEIDQQILLNLGKELSIRHAARVYAERKNQTASFVKAGAELIKLPQNEMDSWNNMPEILQYQKELTQELKGKGLPAIEMKNIFFKLLKNAKH